MHSFERTNRWKHKPKWNYCFHLYVCSFNAACLNVADNVEYNYIFISVFFSKWLIVYYRIYKGLSVHAWAPDYLRANTRQSSDTLHPTCARSWNKVAPAINIYVEELSMLYITFFSLRKTTDGETDLTGNSAAYQPRACMHCSPSAYITPRCVVHARR